MAKKIKNRNKKKAWDNFSRFIRIRDCLATTGMAFVGVCITCGRQFHITYLQAGHCLPGRSNAKLFNEKLTHAQCKWCNEIKHGERDKYEAKMIEKYGEGVFEQMKIDSKKMITDVEMGFEEIALKYDSKYKKLMIENGFKTYGELCMKGKY